MRLRAPADAPGLTAAPAAAAAAATYCPDGLKVTLTAKHGNRQTAVSSIHATTNGHKTQFVLLNGSSASLGTAVRYGSAWSTGGTVSRRLITETGWGARTGAVSKVLQTRYTVASYKNTVGEYGVCSTYYTKKALSHEGGAESHDTALPKATYCRNDEKGGSLALIENRAVTWSNGLSMASIIGLDLSSRAGWSTGERLRVDITATGRKICGTNRLPGRQPTRVVVKHR